MRESSLHCQQVRNKLCKCKIPRFGNEDTLGSRGDLFTQGMEAHRKVRGCAPVRGLRRWAERMHRILARKFILDPDVYPHTTQKTVLSMRKGGGALQWRGNP